MEDKRAFGFQGFDTWKLAELEIDNNDLQLLCYISWLGDCKNMDKFLMDNELYVWIRNEKIVAENPNLHLKERAVLNALNKLCDKKMLKKTIKCDEGSKLRKTYWCITEEFKNLKFIYKNEERQNVDNTLEPSVRENKKKLVENEPINSDVLDIYNYWNSFKIIEHKHLSEGIEKQILKTLVRSAGVNKIKEAIRNYATVYNDKNYYFSYKWTLVEFLKQENAMPTFFNEGDKWQNYVNSRNKSYQKKVSRPGENLEGQKNVI